jgi:predicted DNA repair protein MutK
VLLVAAPWLMRTLAVLGTAAMFLVGGSILVHGLPVLHETAALASQAPLLGWALDGAVGLLAGALLVAVLKMAGAWRRRVSDKR